jgi:hypothetical protein
MGEGVKKTRPVHVDLKAITFANFRDVRYFRCGVDRSRFGRLSERDNFGFGIVNVASFGDERFDGFWMKFAVFALTEEELRAI